MNEHAEPAVAIPAVPEVAPDWDADVGDPDVLDDVVPFALTAAGELAAGAPTVRGVLVTTELLVAIGRVEAAHALARTVSPIGLGDFLGEVHAAVHA